MFEYTREVFYYETDKMGIVHHSNYTRWLEEARIRFFASVGLAYEETEKLDIFNPVVSMSLHFRHSAHFGEKFTVKLKITRYTGVRFYVDYSIINEEGTLLTEAESCHAFVNRKFRPISLKNISPEKHNKMQRCIFETKNDNLT